MKYVKTFEKYYHDGSIDEIKVGQKVKYKDKECIVVENTGERIDLEPIDGSKNIEVFHYQADDIKIEW